MGVREIDRFLETMADGSQRFASAGDSGAHAPEGERWYAILLLARA